MGKGNFSDEFKRDAVAQITERGYAVAEVSERLGVSQHSLYQWKKKFAQARRSGDTEKDAEIRRLKKELLRVTEERDILKKPPRISPGMPSEIRVRCRASPAVFGACNVPVPAHSSQRLLCLAEGSTEQASPGRCSTDGVDPGGMGRERQGLWLPQAP